MAVAALLHVIIFCGWHKEFENLFGKEFRFYHMISVALSAWMLQMDLDSDFDSHAFFQVVAALLFLAWSIAWHKRLPVLLWNDERFQAVFTVGLLALLIQRNGKVVAQCMLSCIGVLIYLDRRCTSSTNDAVYLAARFHQLNHMGGQGCPVPRSTANQLCSNMTRAFLVRYLRLQCWTFGFWYSMLLFAPHAS